MKHFTFFPIALVLLFATACDLYDSSAAKEQNEVKPNFEVNHFNITIASDLSNRLNTALYPKQVTDCEIVDIVVDNIYPTILTHRRSMNQLDKFRLDFINKKQITAYNVNTEKLSIDFGEFGNHQVQRIAYLKNGFNQDKDALKQEFKRTYNNALTKHFGSDIWTYLQQGIDESIVNLSTSNGKTGSSIFKNKFRNVLVLITDGYIEAGIYGKGYDLSGNQIEGLRSAFLKSGETDLLKFYQKNPRFKIKALTNPLLKDIEILVLELYDRTESNGGATVHPTDYEIIKIVWNEWLTSSGAKRVVLHPKFSNKAEAQRAIMSFLEV